jgi:hypothetical protein
MTFGLAPASNDSNFTLKMVFSFGFSYRLILTATGSSDTTALATGAADAAGIAIS